MPSEHIARFLKEVHQLPPPPPTQPTIFEITGYPHLENVSSNVLAFYLQPNNPHGLGNMLLRTLYHVIDYPAHEVEMLDVSIHREETTAKNKRIDIIIETESTIIGIENKIYHVLSNDLGAYWQHLSSNAKGRDIMGVVLSLKPVALPEKSKFVCITYKDWFETFDLELEHLDFPSKYTVFLQDFVRTIRKLTKGISMDVDKINFFRDHQEELNRLLSYADLLREDMKRRLNELADSLQLEEKYPAVKKMKNWFPSNAAIGSLNYTIVYDPQFVLQIDIMVKLSGWYMQFWNCPHNKHRHRVKQIISKHNIPYRVQDEPVWRLVYTGECPPFEADISDLHTWVSEAINTLLQSS